MSYKAGCENPATSQRSNVISHGVSKPTAAMAGSFARKFPETKKAGQDVAGSNNNQVEIRFSTKSPGKQTWKGSSEGFTTKSVPAYVASPAKSSGSDTSSKSQNKGRQKVKGR
jgi:hypothetical protein